MVQEAEKSDVASRFQPSTTNNQKIELKESKEELLEMLYKMILIRGVEDKIWEMYTRGRIGGYCHTNHGEEATVVGAIYPLRPQDWIVSYYREHGHILARGSEPRRVMAELFGRQDGVSHGRGGSMHLFDAQRRFMGGYGIVAGNFPLAIGTGWSSKYRKVDEVTLCMSGEGSTANGAFHESMNMIGVFSLPVITLIVNNLYGMGTTVDRSQANPEIWKRGEMYAMHGVKIDGMDVIEVKHTMEDCIRRAQNGQPCLIEAITYRYRGHSVADPARYRSQEEVQSWRDQDPIERFYRQLLEANVITEEERKSIEERVEGVVQEAVQFAEQSPEPDPAGLLDFLYVNPPPNA